MRRSPFAKAVASWNPDDTPLRSAATKWLTEGGHPVVIEDVDTRHIDAHRVVLTLRSTESQAYHKEYMFVLSKDQQSLSREFRGLLGALLPDLSAIEDYKYMLNHDDYYMHALECLRGMRVWVEIERTPGYVCMVMDGVYRAMVGDTVLCEGKNYDDVDKQAQVKQVQKSRRRVIAYKSIDTESESYNLDALDAAITAISGTASADSPVDKPQPRRFQGTGST